MSDASAGISTEDFLREQSEISRPDGAQMLAALLGQTIARKGQFAAFASTMGRTAQRNGDHGVPVLSLHRALLTRMDQPPILTWVKMPFMENKIDPESG